MLGQGKCFFYVMVIKKEQKLGKMWSIYIKCNEQGKLQLDHEQRKVLFNKVFFSDKTFNI